MNLSNFTLSGVSTTATKALDLQNGTFKLTSTQTLTISSGTNGSDYPIPYTSQLWLNGGNMRITTTGTGAGLLLGGKLRIDAGTFYIEGGGTNDNYVEIAGGNIPAVEINGGELRVGSQIRRANTSTISALSYTQTAGTVTVGTQTATNTNRALLEVLNNGSAFVDDRRNACYSAPAGGHTNHRGVVPPAVVIGGNRRYHTARQHPVYTHGAEYPDIFKYTGIRCGREQHKQSYSNAYRGRSYRA